MLVTAVLACGLRLFLLFCRMHGCCYGYEMQPPPTNGFTQAVAVDADTVADVSVMMPPPAALTPTQPAVDPSAATVSPLQAA